MELKASEVARALADAFEASGVPYAIGGALALAYWAPPRATNDVDVDVFVDEAQIGTVFRAIRSIGAHVDETEARRRIEDRGDFRADLEGMRIDVFVAFADLHEGVKARRRQVLLRGRLVWVLSAEDTVVFKMLFDRPKDWIDIELVMAAGPADLDVTTIRSVFTSWVGAGDSRLARLDELASRHRPG